MEDTKMGDETKKERTRASRRDFLKNSAAAVVGGAVASRLGYVPAGHAAGSDQIKNGLFGWGQRGAGGAEAAPSSSRGGKRGAGGGALKDDLGIRVDVLRKSKEAG